MIWQDADRKENTTPDPRPNLILIWVSSAAFLSSLFALLDGRMIWSVSISSLHPIHLIAQIGAGLFLFAIAKRSLTLRYLWLFIGLASGLLPLIWLLTHDSSAHVWLDPFLRRIHGHIVEFQGPFENGLWSIRENWHAFLCATVAIVAVFKIKKSPVGKFCIPTITLLTILSLLQTRWLGLLATSSCLCIAIALPQAKRLWIAGLALSLLFFSNWIIHWTQIEKSPDQIFMTDMILQVSARDVNLNLAELTSEQTIVAMPYAFAPTSALFKDVHPLGTFYWENREGLFASSILFADSNESDAKRVIEEYDIDYLLVQGGALGAPFAKLVTESVTSSDEPNRIKASLAWRLSTRRVPPSWLEELPIYGTFTPEQIHFRLYRVK